MQRAADLIGFKMLLQFVAARVPHDIQMPGTLGVISFAWKPQWSVTEQFTISLSHSTALQAPGRQMLKLHAKHGPLDTLHAIIIADFVVIVPAGGAMVPQRPRARGECSVARQ